ANQKAYVHFGGEFVGGAIIQLYSISGSLIDQFETNESITSVDLPQSNTYYILKVVYNDSVTTYKVKK
ncbi:MAG: hypothetical protein JW717_00595, partial [Marinilabiliaceae bacterium]|nr:hypothetical protein [Marinilabiliaceae bacterium]